MDSILVATDGSETADKAVLRARELAECTGSRVTIITIVANDVLEPPYLITNKNDIKTNEQLIRLGEELLQKTVRLFKDFQGVVETVVRSGDTAEEIIKEAETGDYDLLIMGSRGLGTFPRALLGSVSNKVSNHVKKDIWIIR